MYRNIFTNKWIIGGFCFLILFSGLCYFYYQHETVGLKEQTATVKQSKREKTAATVKQTEQTGDASVESITPTAEKPITEATGAETDTSTDKITKPITASMPQTDKTAEERVSPHGFGPYPEVPEDFPENVNWSYYEKDLPIYELMTRVQIELWKQGQLVTGVSEENGLIYPIIRGTVYIKWSHNGEDIINFTGHPEDMSDAIIDSMLESSTIPAGLKVLDYDKSGIDPYKFLNL
jgi:hypothetical protein